MDYRHLLPVDTERRFLTAEVRKASGSKRSIEGYAAVFGAPSDPMLGFNERCMPGMFARAVQEKQDTVALINHDQNLVLGRVRNNTLTLREDSRGLFFSCLLPETSYADDLWASVERGDISQCSFSFIAKKQKWVSEPDGTKTRELQDVDLLDVSAVTVPVYAATSVKARDLGPHDLATDENTVNDRRLHIAAMFPNGVSASQPELRSILDWTHFMRPHLESELKQSGAQLNRRRLLDLVRQ